ncbi:MAG: hypothetical protein V1646_01400 [bacterium]
MNKKLSYRMEFFIIGLWLSNLPLIAMVQITAESIHVQIADQSKAKPISVKAFFNALNKKIPDSDDGDFELFKQAVKKEETNIKELLGRHKLDLANYAKIKAIFEGAQTDPQPAIQPPSATPTIPLSKATFFKILTGKDLADIKGAVIADLKDKQKAIDFFKFLQKKDIGSLENLRQFLASNGFGESTETRKAFEEKAESLGPTKFSDSDLDLKLRLISKFKMDDQVDAEYIERLISDVERCIKTLSDTTAAIPSFITDRAAKIKELEAKKTQLAEKLEKQKTIKAEEKKQVREKAIDDSIKKNVSRLSILSPDSLNDFVAAFTFPYSITDLTSDGKKEIITKSWLNYTSFQSKLPYEQKKKALYFIIQFKIYNFTKSEFNTKFNTHAGTTNFDYYSIFFPGTTNLAKQFETIKTEITNINGTVNNIMTIFNFWEKLTLSISKTDLIKQLPEAIIKKLKAILTDNFLQDKITDTNKENIRKIVQALFNYSEISDTLKTNLGFKKVIKIVGAKTIPEQIQNLQTKFLQIANFEDLPANQKLELNNVQSLLSELGLTEKNSHKEIFVAIKAYKAPQPSAPDQQPQPGQGTPPPMPARPLNQQLKTLKTNLTQLKVKIEMLNAKLTALRGAL